MSNWYSGELIAAEPFKANLVPSTKIKFKDALFSVNPADMNSKTVLTVYIEEETVYLRPYYMRAGELLAGEV